MSKIVQKLRTGKENTYHIFMIGIGALFWAIIAFIIYKSYTTMPAQAATLVHVYMFYGIAIAIFYFISSALYRANAFGNMILLGTEQFPDLHAMVVAGSAELGLSEPPKTFLYNSNGLFNAFARRLMGGRYVFLTSALVEANDDEQVRFIIGHELGHHAAGHLNP